MPTELCVPERDKLTVRSSRALEKHAIWTNDTIQHFVSRRYMLQRCSDASGQSLPTEAVRVHPVVIERS